MALAQDTHRGAEGTRQRMRAALRWCHYSTAHGRDTHHCSVITRRHMRATLTATVLLELGCRPVMMLCVSYVCSTDFSPANTNHHGYDALLQMTDGVLISSRCKAANEWRSVLTNRFWTTTKNLFVVACERTAEPLRPFLVNTGSHVVMVTPYLCFAIKRERNTVFFFCSDV